MGTIQNNPRATSCLRVTSGAVALACFTIATSSWADSVVVDFSLDPKPESRQVANAVMTELLRRFPHPHANGKTCDPNYPNTPAKERAGGQLLPYITSVDAAITKKQKQTAYVIDYCPTGNGVPRTRRLLVLDGTAVAIDRELPASIPATAIIATTDIDGDGRAELVLTDTEHRKRAVTVVYLVRARATDLKLLGSWTGLEHCSVLEPPDEIVHRITAAGPDGPFKDTAIKRRCYYPPKAP